MIDERREEQAGRYVLEALPPAERTDFEAALASDPDLPALVASLRAVRDALAGAVPPVTPPPQLKKRLLADWDARDKKLAAPAAVPADPSSPPHSPASAPAPAGAPADFMGFWLPWTFCAVAVMLAVNWRMDKSDLTNRALRQHERIEELNQDLDALRTTTNTLQQAVATLTAASKVDEVHISLLGSPLTDFPKPLGVSLWDSTQQTGVLVTQYLTPLTPDRDYELWIIDPQYLTPVSAAIFQVDSQGWAHIHFKPEKPIGTARQFAITQEPKGGSPAPTFRNMVLVGAGDGAASASTNLP